MTFAPSTRRHTRRHTHRRASRLTALLAGPALALLLSNTAQAVSIAGQAYQITDTFSQYFGPPGGVQVFNGSGSHSYSGTIGAGYEATNMGLGTFDSRGAVNGAAAWLDIDPAAQQITAWVYVDKFGRYVDPWNVHIVLPNLQNEVFTSAALTYDIATFATPTIQASGNALDISLAGQHAGNCTVDGCVWEFRFGYTVGAVAAVPEPASAALLALGLCAAAGAAAAGRRRQP